MIYTESFAQTPCIGEDVTSLGLAIDAEPIHTPCVTTPDTNNKVGCSVLPAPCFPVDGVASTTSRTRHDPYWHKVTQRSPPLILQERPPAYASTNVGQHGAGCHYERGQLHRAVMTKIGCSMEFVDAWEIERRLCYEARWCDADNLVAVVVKNFPSNEYMRQTRPPPPHHWLNGCIAAACTNVEGPIPWVLDARIPTVSSQKLGQVTQQFPKGTIQARLAIPQHYCEGNVTAFLDHMSYHILADRDGVWFDWSGERLKEVGCYYQRLQTPSRHQFTDGLPTGPLIFEWAHHCHRW